MPVVSAHFRSLLSLGVLDILRGVVRLAAVGPHRCANVRCGLLSPMFRGLCVSVKPTKTAEPIEMPFGMRTGHVLVGSGPLPRGMGNFVPAH